jgi:hypothetical protein
MGNVSESPTTVHNLIWIDKYVWYFLLVSLLTSVMALHCERLRRLLLILLSKSITSLVACPSLVAGRVVKDTHFFLQMQSV